MNVRSIASDEIHRTLCNKARSKRLRLMKATASSRSRRNRIRSLTPSTTDTHLSITRFEPRPEPTRERWVHVRLIESPHLSHRTELTAVTTGIEGLSHRLPHLQRE